MTLVQRRILITLFVWVLAALAGCYYANAASKCGERIKSFALWEDLAPGSGDIGGGDDKFIEKHSIYTIPEGTNDSSDLGGFLIRNTEDPNTKLEIDVKQKGELRKYSFGFIPWERDDTYLVTDGLNTDRDIVRGFAPGSFVMRITLDGNLLCKDSPRKIEEGD